MKLSVLLTLKPTPMIKELLESMYESIENAVDDYEILFSTADLSEKSIRLLLKWKNTRPIDVGDNKSRAHFWNIGFNQIAPDSDLILLFDLDSILFQNSVWKMIEKLESDSRIGAVSAYVNQGVYGVQNFNLQFSNFDELPDAVEKFESEYCNKQYLVAFLEGTCILAHRTLFEKIKSRYGFLVDKRFSMNFYDDMDLSIRILCEDFKMEIAPTYIYKIESHFEDFFEKKSSVEILFKSIWGFLPAYSLLIRNDILWMVEDFEREGIQILEVGCAAGGSLYMMHDKNPTAELHGIEINLGAAKVASTFAEVENVDIEKFAPDHWKNKFDYIICGDVIEHLVDPWGALKNIHKMLKPGGHLIASIPNVAHISVIAKLLSGFWKYEDAGILDRTHLRFFTENSIRQYLDEAGFKIQTMISKQINITETWKSLIDHFIKMFNVDPKHFTTFQYLVDATK